MSNYKEKKMKEFDEKYPHQASIMFERDNVKEFISQTIDETEQRVKGDYDLKMMINFDMELARYKVFSMREDTEYARGYNKALRDMGKNAIDNIKSLC